MNLLEPGPYRLAAEWAPRSSTWIAWPHERSDWPGKFSPVHWVFAEVVRILSEHEQVNILVNDSHIEDRVIDRLVKSGVDLTYVLFHLIETDRGWLRDTGPMIVQADSKAGLDSPAAPRALTWNFNGWAKYENHKRDARIAESIADRLQIERSAPDYMFEGRRIRFTLEGGAIDVDGLGTLLTTEECLLSPIQERNPGLDRSAVERILAAELGVSRIVWLNRGIVGDDTHGHVDDIARFVAPGVIVAAYENTSTDENYEPLAENLDRLRRARDYAGVPFEIVTLPMPRPVYFDEQRLPASYANFYIASKVVLAPTFNDPADRIALQTLESLFPDHEVVGVYCRDLVLGLGTLHCMTRDIPRFN